MYGPNRFLALIVCVGLLPVTAYPQQAAEVDIDPWDTANEVLPDTDQAIVVSIKSTQSGPTGAFDATQADPATVTLGAGNAGNFAMPAIHDVDDDGDEDLVLAFRTSEAGIGCSDNTISLRGETYSGALFRGTDSITTLDCPSGCHATDPPERIATPMIVGDSMSEDPADWWNLSTEFDPVEFDVFASAGEQLGRHDNDPTRGMVRNLSGYLDTATTADSLIIFGGTNDVSRLAHAGEMKFALADMIDAAKRRPEIRDIIVIGPTPFGNFRGWYSWGPKKQTQQEEYMSWLPGFTAAEGVQYLDVYSLLGDPNQPEALHPDYELDDNLHLNVLGALQVSAAVDALVLTSRTGPEKGPLNIAQQNLGWNSGNRVYDGVTITTHELAWDRTTSETQSLPADAFLPATGKWYIELKITYVKRISNARVGLLRQSTHDPSWSGGLGYDGPHPSINLYNAQAISDGSIFGSNLPDIEAGSVIGIAYDADADLMWINVNGHWQEHTQDNALPEAGTGGKSVADASDYQIAVETTSTDLTIEFPNEIPASHVPAGFSTIY
jgi:hypothetical protein